ncbi:hypothetical protein ABTP93_20185, partial [Acinetobacter baumannii]
ILFHEAADQRDGNSSECIAATSAKRGTVPLNRTWLPALPNAATLAKTTGKDARTIVVRRK